MVTTAVLLLLAVLVFLVAAALWHVIRLNQSQGSLWDVLRQVEARRDEDARAAALLTARLETNLGQTEASMKVLEYGLRNGQARMLEAFAALAMRAQADGQALKESMQALEAQEAERGRRVAASLEQIKTRDLETEKSIRSLESCLSKSQGRMRVALRERPEAYQAAAAAGEDEPAVAALADQTRALEGKLTADWEGAPEALPDDKVKRPAAPDFGFQQRTESENLSVAKSLAFVRPLVPRPGWRFDVEWDNPDLAFQMRRQLWCYFNKRGLHSPLVMDWYDGLRVNVYLGNDMSKQMFIGGCYEPNEFAFLNTVLAPGMTVVDAGANAGLYSLFASRRVGPAGEVWAFEPSERDFTRLQQNLELNNLTNVRVFRVALANCNGEAELAVAGCEHEGQNTLGSFAYDAATLLQKERVSLGKLDDLAAEQHLSRVDLIKVDVEGAEFRVFEGAQTILEKMRPMLLFELSQKALNNQGASSEDLLALLRSFDYRIYTFDEETGQPVLANGRALSDNLVAAPSERPLSVTSTVA